ncbi:MAG: ABC transporter substrate-binding protein [Promethearchaeota archaeon]
MESGTKRIVAIVLIAVIAVGVGVGVYFLVFTGPEQVWKTPGAPSGITEDQWIKVGLMGDRGELEGDQNYMGGYLAARKINSEGGVVVNGTHYYFAIASEDTDESAADFSTSRAVAAAERMIYKDECQFAVGGFRTESLLAYREPFMENKIPFFSTGAMSDVFTESVRDNKPRYKYYWRISPYNSSYSSASFVPAVLGMYSYLRTVYGSDDIDHMGILAEDLTWTEGIRTVVDDIINGVFPGAVPAEAVIAFAPDVSPTTMDNHLQTLETAGCDVVLIAISLGAGLVMTQKWKEAERPFMLFGSNVQAQTAGYWDKTDGACEYEIGSTTATRCNKTPHTIECYDLFIDEFNEHPIYIGFAAYDSFGIMKKLIESTQSFDVDVLMTEMETYNKSNPMTGGAGGDPVAWNKNHDLVAGYPFSYGIWFQWQNGTKTLIPSLTPYILQPPQYPNTLYPMGSVEIPDWVEWDIGP